MPVVLGAPVHLRLLFVLVQVAAALLVLWGLAGQAGLILLPPARQGAAVPIMVLPGLSQQARAAGQAVLVDKQVPRAVQVLFM
jgi:hypothetical protein